jgi:hypothetical protein
MRASTYGSGCKPHLIQLNHQRRHLRLGPPPGDNRPKRVNITRLGDGPGWAVMTARTHGIGVVAAIGGLTATIALLTGLSAARADELADLRINQELLHRRIEQLAKATEQFPGAAARAVLGTQPVSGAALIGGSFP